MQTCFRDAMSLEKAPFRIHLHHSSPCSSFCRRKQAPRKLGVSVFGGVPCTPPSISEKSAAISFQMNITPHCYLRRSLGASHRVRLSHVMTIALRKGPTTQQSYRSRRSYQTRRNPPPTPFAIASGKATSDQGTIPHHVSVCFSRRSFRPGTQRSPVYIPGMPPIPPPRLARGSSCSCLSSLIMSSAGT